MRLAREHRPDERRREMPVAAREISRDARAGIRQRAADAVRERADAEDHGVGGFVCAGWFLTRHFLRTTKYTNHAKSQFDSVRTQYFAAEDDGDWP